jgi:hypothetical protein
MKTTMAALTLVLVPQLALAEEKAEKKPAILKNDAGEESGRMKAPPKPGPELDALKPLTGMWTCDGKAPASPMGPAHGFTSTINSKWELGNFWLETDYSVKKSKENPMAFNARAWMGYDPTAKHYVFLGVDDKGGGISLTSSGWEGDKLEWTGDGTGPMGKMKTKFTFIKGKTPSEYTMEFTMQNPKGEWMPPSSETCKKK